MSDQEKTFTVTVQQIKEHQFTVNADSLSEAWYKADAQVKALGITRAGLKVEYWPWSERRQGWLTPRYAETVVEP